MPDENENVTSLSGDMLQQLLQVASEKAAKQEAEEALKKGFITREQINMALGQFKTDLETQLVDKISESLGDRVESAVKKAVTIDPSGRKSTILGGSDADERSDDPVGYLLRKGKEFGPEAYDDTDKRIIWAITYKALSTGMIEDQREEDN